MQNIYLLINSNSAYIMTRTIKFPYNKNWDFISEFFYIIAVTFNVADQQIDKELLDRIAMLALKRKEAIIKLLDSY